VEPAAVGGPIAIVESGRTVIRAFFEAGFWALGSIVILLWIVLRRFGDVLLTIIPLLMAGVVTMELMVLLGMELNFANIIALPLLLGVGVAFKIYYIMAWRADRALAVEPHAGGDVQRVHHRDCVRQPVAVEPSGHVEHGKVDGARARHHHGGGRAVSAGADGAAARTRQEDADQAAAGSAGSRRVGAGSGPRGRRGRKVDEYLTVPHLGAEGLEIGEAGCLHRLPARHVKCAEVQAALDDIAFQDAVSEVGGSVGAARLRGIEGAVDVVDGHELVAHLEAFDVAGRQIGCGADGDGIFGHDLTDPKESHKENQAVALASRVKSSIGKGGGVRGPGGAARN
jgi:hypothetical protein